MARGSVDMRHKSQAYLCVQGNLIAHVFSHVFDNSLHSHNTLVSGLHLFQTFVGICDGEASETFLRIQEERRMWECVQSCQWSGVARPPSNRAC